MLRIAICTGALLMLCMPATAQWDFDGWEVKTMETGIIKGDVFVSYGDKSGLDYPEYTSNFNVPKGEEDYSRLYVGVWGGTEKKTGTLNTVFNSIDIGTITIGGKDDTNPTYTTGTNVYGRGNGVWWVSYNVTGNVTMGEVNTATAKTGGTIDGRVYAIVLVTVYTDPSEIDNIQYWINEGSVNLHYKAPSYSWEQDKTFVWFKGTTANFTHASARLNAVYLTGTKDEPDYLYFNPPDESDSPYSNMAWDIAKYEEYQLDGSNVADASNGEYFDLETFVSTEEKPIKDLILNNNYAVFWRGHDDNNDGTIYSEFDPQGAPLEGESYVGPALAVLVLSEGEEEEEDPDLAVSNAAVPIVSTGKVNTISATIENIGRGTAYSGSAALYVDGAVVSSASISSLSAGKNKTVDFSWKPANEGKYVLFVSADPNNAVKEICEMNNNNTPLNVNVIDIMPPKLTISRPRNGEVLDEDIISISGSVEDTSKNIMVFVNGAAASLSGTDWNAEVPLSQGYNKITVSAVDGANNTATEFVEVKSRGIPSAVYYPESAGENITISETVAKASKSYLVYGFVVLMIIALIVVVMSRRRKHH